MKSETLELTQALDEAAAMVIARVLKSVNGVSKVAISTTNASVAVDFDDELTSTQEIRTVLKQAGVGLKKAAGEAGMCCGSCGS
ncbi:hypothetical protein GCM10027343_04110 [Noviherbaspirillum agri]